ncbi:hypothetical protein [Jiangella alkaliphila]|uniref:Uncharacterized protein n=1 Tax=Jiangella alkaliphila TaxID=419479 RepID=A0A1H2GHQ6_9ACTN|nr:hypothetical protein [Jiangella alkaliphila]SDU18941.1 hypothetical protein SAMN04488563_0497 [Jiangella alkaliphila]
MKTVLRMLVVFLIYCLAVFLLAVLLGSLGGPIGSVELVIIMIAVGVAEAYVIRRMERRQSA